MASHPHRRILLVSPTPHTESGWGTYASLTAKKLAERGHALINLTPDKGLPPPLSMIDAPLARVAAAWVIAKAIRTHRPEIIHVLVEPYVLAMPLVSRFMRLPPWVMNLHGTYTLLPLESARTRRILCAAYDKASLLFSCSKYTTMRTLQGIAKHCGSAAARHAEKNVRQFRFGIEPGAFVSRTDNTEKHILFVGHVKPRKGIVELVRACGAFRRLSSCPFRLDIVGEYERSDPYITLVKETIRQEGLEKNIHLRGRLEQAALDRCYSSADLFMMLSRSEGVHYEGFGLVFLEAASRGIPVIGSRDSGCREALQEGVTGYALDAHDSGGIAERMRDILEHGAIRREDCRAWADTHTMDTQIDRFEDLYAEALTM